MKRKRKPKPPTGELVVKVVKGFAELDERNQAVVEGFIYGLLNASQQKKAG
ncbi:MAG: hypothetical protein UE295_11915 [Acutalibacteraceae bacterium]|nr:hypothetical protein [Acutalibacteraceae bacterium]